MPFLFALTYIKFWVVPLLVSQIAEGIFSQVREPTHTNKLRRCAGRSLAAGKATSAGQVSGSVPD
jgi:hypothetical protein